MSESSSETTACEVCGVLATPLSSDPAIQQLIAHLSDYSDPHHTLESTAKVRYGSATPVVGQGYNEGDWYIDLTNHALYSYRKTSDDPETFQWVAATPSISSSLDGYVYRSPLYVDGVRQQTEITAILAAYLTSASAATTYATKSELSTLSTTVDGIDTSLSGAVYRTGSANVVRNIDTILNDYLRTADLATAVSGKQDTLTAGTNITITNNVISASTPSLSDATTSTAGLMSADDKLYLSGLPTTIAGLQTRLTNASNAGSNISIDSNGRISATAYGLATTSASGLMSAADKTKLDGMNPSDYGYTLPAATDQALGGVLVNATRLTDQTTVNSVTTRTTPSGYSTLYIGISGMAYCKAGDAATTSTLGTVKAGSVLSSTTGYAKCPIDADGYLYYQNAVTAAATGSTLGGVKVDSTVLSDTSGYSKVKIDSSGFIYYPNATVSAATSIALGGVMVDSTTLTIGTLGDWAKTRVDSDGYLYYKENIASYGSLGHVKVSGTVLSDTSGFSLCQVDSNGFIYAPAVSTATSSALGGVMVDSEEVDSDDPEEYVKCRVDESGVIYSKGYDDAIAELRHQGAGHDILVTASVANNVCSLTNNAMNYVPVTSTQSMTLQVPARLNPATNARDFFVVFAFSASWASSNTFSVAAVTSATSGETVQVFAADGEGLTFTNISAGATVMVYFTEVTSGTFVVSRKTTSRIF